MQIFLKRVANNDIGEYLEKSLQLLNYEFRGSFRVDHYVTDESGRIWIQFSVDSMKNSELYDCLMAVGGDYTIEYSSLKRLVSVADDNRLRIEYELK